MKAFTVTVFCVILAFAAASAAFKTKTQDDGSALLNLLPHQESGAEDFECREDGFFANEDYCNKFIRCEDYGVGYGFIRFDFDCAPGTDLWCQDKLTCAFSADCPGTPQCD